MAAMYSEVACSKPFEGRRLGSCCPVTGPGTSVSMILTSCLNRLKITGRTLTWTYIVLVRGENAQSWTRSLRGDAPCAKEVVYWDQGINYAWIRSLSSVFAV